MTKRVKIFLISFFISLPFWWGVNIFQVKAEKFFYAQIAGPLENIILVKIEQKKEKPPLDIIAKSALSVRISESGVEKVFFKKNENDVLPIASLTKLMTALVVLSDSRYALDGSDNAVVISKAAAGQANVPVFGNLDSGVDTMIKPEELLSLMLIYSSNDAAFALSEIIGTDDFIRRMNYKANESELNNTYFVNPTGLDPDINIEYNQNSFIFFNHSTARDLQKLVEFAVKEYPIIFDISLKQGPYPTENGIAWLTLPEKYKAIGGKTGYTSAAGGCMIFLFQDDKKNIFINIILGSDSSITRVEDMQKLIDWLAI